MMTAQTIPPDGVILAQVLGILDESPGPHPSFGSPAFPLSILEHQLSITSGALDTGHIIVLIAPLADTLFDVPRHPVSRRLGKDNWIVFEQKERSRAEAFAQQIMLSKAVDGSSSPRPSRVTRPDAEAPDPTPFNPGTPTDLRASPPSRTTPREAENDAPPPSAAASEDVGNRRRGTFLRPLLLGRRKKDKDEGKTVALLDDLEIARRQKQALDEFATHQRNDAALPRPGDQPEDSSEIPPSPRPEQEGNGDRINMETEEETKHATSTRRHRPKPSSSPRRRHRATEVDEVMDIEKKRTREPDTPVLEDQRSEPALSDAEDGASSNLEQASDASSDSQADDEEEGQSEIEEVDEGRKGERVEAGRAKEKEEYDVPPPVRRHQSKRRPPVTKKEATPIPTSYLVQVFEGLPFGTDVPAFAMIDWVRHRWQILLAQVFAILVAAYVLQVTGW
ncbi:hypothetical protein P7C73_g2636, partial [Tremellales sp. Uapishka_1]